MATKDRIENCGRSQIIALFLAWVRAQILHSSLRSSCNILHEPTGNNALSMTESLEREFHKVVDLNTVYLY